MVIHRDYRRWDQTQVIVRATRPGTPHGNWRMNMACDPSISANLQPPTMQVDPVPSLPAEGEGEQWWETEEDRSSWIEFLEANKVRPKPAKLLWILTY